MRAMSLGRARKRFVSPFYLHKLNVDAMKDPRSRAKFLKACSALDKRTAHMILSEREWRGRTTVAWMIGVNRWDEFVPQISRQLIESELVYAGQGYCVGLALITTEPARDALVAYLDRWLPELDCHYDQPWAMGALVEVDRALSIEGRPGAAERYLADGGSWDRWCAAQHRRTAPTPAPVSEIVSLLRNGSGGHALPVVDGTEARDRGQ